MKFEHRIRTLALSLGFAACLAVLGSCSADKPVAVEVENASGNDFAGDTILVVIGSAIPSSSESDSGSSS